MNNESISKAEKFWDRAAKSYDREEKKDEKIYQQILEKLNTHLKSTDHVLDFGCGTGLISNKLTTVVEKIHGIDVSSKMIEIAREKAKNQSLKNITYEHATLFDNRLEQGTYDAVLSFYILHLLDDAQMAIEKTHELLKTDGLLISVTPCMGEKPLMKSLFAFLSKLKLVPKIKSFKQNDLVQLLTTAGFEIIVNEKLSNTSNQYFIVAKK
jgi:ubiquinone/menaquinone biosynthesis C-methylase UbiE